MSKNDRSKDPNEFAGMLSGLNPALRQQDVQPETEPAKPSSKKAASGDLVPLSNDNMPVILSVRIPLRLRRKVKRDADNHGLTMMEYATRLFEQGLVDDDQ